MPLVFGLSEGPSGADDLTLIPGLDRAVRDVLVDEFPTIADLAAADPRAYIHPDNKTIFRRVGADPLFTFHERAKLLAMPGAVPYLKHPVRLPAAGTELFFDIRSTQCGTSATCMAS
jgi:hypothetical protein